MDINILLFDDFTALDVFGPVEVLSSIKEWRLRFLSVSGGLVANHQGVQVMTEPLSGSDYSAVWLIPGGWGTRSLVDNQPFLSVLRAIAKQAAYCLSVCTGSALLGRCGALDGRQATTNRRAFDWVASVGGEVGWQREARWVRDGKFYTSAGVSAGIDMALAFVADQKGTDVARAIAERMEYRGWE